MVMCVNLRVVGGYSAGVVVQGDERGDDQNCDRESGHWAESAEPFEQSFAQRYFGRPPGCGGRSVGDVSGVELIRCRVLRLTDDFAEAFSSHSYLAYMDSISPVA